MLNLAEYRSRPAGLADFLPWAALVEEGVVLNKDGSFQRTARFRGPDLDSATPAELVGVTARLNNALRRLGSGWAIFVEAQRIAAQTYPHSTFPDPASALVDLERQDAFEEAGARIIENQPGLMKAHFMGTTRMGNDPARSVTDRWGMTHDIPNLGGIDGGIFVTSSSFNPTPTLAALALRDRVAQIGFSDARLMRPF